jgi:hypothetical protein
VVAATTVGWQRIARSTAAQRHIFRIAVRTGSFDRACRTGSFSLKRFSSRHWTGFRLFCLSACRRTQAKACTQGNVGFKAPTTRTSNHQPRFHLTRVNKHTNELHQLADLLVVETSLTSLQHYPLQATLIVSKSKLPDCSNRRPPVLDLCTVASPLRQLLRDKNETPRNKPEPSWTALDQSFGYCSPHIRWTRRSITGRVRRLSCVAWS